MRYQILIENEGKTFSYSTDSYEFDDYFIKFEDKKLGVVRQIPKHRVVEVIDRG